MTMHPKQPFAKPALTVRRAVREDRPALVRLLKRFAEERGLEAKFDPAHADRHMQHALEAEMTFIAFAGEEPAGAIICRHVDIGICRLDDIETDYIYLAPEHRSLPAISALLNAMEAFADERNISVCVHQLDYVAAIAGEESNGRRVEALFKFRDYRSRVGDVYTRQPYVRTGVTYLYKGDPNKPSPTGVPGVRTPKKKD